MADAIKNRYPVSYNQIAARLSLCFILQKYNVLYISEPYFNKLYYQLILSQQENY